MPIEDPSTSDGPFPLNRLVALLAPFVSTAAGTVASWLLVHVHLLGLFHFQHDGLAAGIAQGAVFVLVTAITYAAHHKWLDGWSKWERMIAFIGTGPSLPMTLVEAPQPDIGPPVGGDRPEGVVDDPLAP